MIIIPVLGAALCMFPYFVLSTFYAERLNNLIYAYHSEHPLAAQVSDALYNEHQIWCTYFFKDLYAVNVSVYFGLCLVFIVAGGSANLHMLYRHFKLLNLRTAGSKRLQRLSRQLLVALCLQVNDVF